MAWDYPLSEQLKVSIFSAALKGVNLTVNGCHGFPEETPALVAAATARSLERIAVARWLTARICRSHGGM